MLVLVLVSVDSNMVKLHSRRGRALMRLGRFTEANEAFTLLLDATAPYLHGKHIKQTN